MSNDGVTAEVSGVRAHLDDLHVGTITFSRPPHNFFDVALATEIADACDSLAADPACRVVLLRGAGKHFCAGARLQAGAEDLITSAPPDENPLYEQARRIAACAVPMIAVIQGAAIGGGLGLALAADFRIACPEARFAANFAQLGMHQGFGISVTLPAVVGQQHALDLLYTGRRLTAEEALQIGLVDRLVPRDELTYAAQDFTSKIASSAPLAVRSIRRTMRAGLLSQMASVTRHEHAAQRELRQTHDFTEGVDAYARRRTADFQAR